MKVLQITTTTKGGAGIAALRLHNALVANGIQSAFISTNLTIDYSNKINKDSFFEYKRPSVFQRIFYKVLSYILPSQEIQIKKKLNKILPLLKSEITTLPFSVFETHKHPLVLQADIINLHWVSGIINYQTFFKNCNKPIVWTLHDMSPFQGIFHYKGDEIRNQAVAGNLDIQVKEIKQKSIHQILKGATVTPSEWLLKEAIGNNFNPKCLYKTIPNAIDLSVFNIQNQEALRNEFGISKDDFKLLFVADKLDNPRKGFDLLLDALRLLKHLPITIITIGKGKIEESGFKNIALGNIESAEKMASIYALTDVFILPSREDNLPNVMLEAFACGIPIISFNHGGMKEYVRENFTGVLVKEMTGKGLADAITNFYSNRKEYSPKAIRKYAEDNFSFAKQATQYTILYKDLLQLNES